ncbi:MAG: addiction module protein [Chroococcales cyanobacterium]|uniref:addiction module protein n=1 Tax=Laspinema palackyanum TaxID=3231601 RepID=UPI00348D5290|nr:addiction module protein [Laspinema sp. D2b]
MPTITQYIAPVIWWAMPTLLAIIQESVPHPQNSMVNAAYDDVLSAAINLSPHLRVMLAEQLLNSLDTVAQNEINAAWAEEAEKRVLGIQEGRVTRISGSEVMQELRERHQK